MQSNLFFLEDGDAVSLDEAGGLSSWIQRTATGFDRGLITELRAKLKTGIKTKKEKQELVKEIDRFISEVEHGSVRQVGVRLISSRATSDTIGYLKQINSQKIAKYVSDLKKIRSEVANYEV